MSTSHVHVYEKMWMWAAALMIALFLSVILYSSIAQAQHPASHVETIDPTTARTDPRFANPGVTIKPDGSAEVIVLAQMFSFSPYEIKVPANKPVRFRITSPDVTHGFQIVSTNGNTMVVPGYVSQFTTEFKPGQYLIVCNEYCGLGHHMMHGLMVAEGGRP